MKLILILLFLSSFIVSYSITTIIYGKFPTPMLIASNTVVTKKPELNTVIEETTKPIESMKPIYTMKSLPTLKPIQKVEVNKKIFLKAKEIQEEKVEEIIPKSFIPIPTPIKTPVIIITPIIIPSETHPTEEPIATPLPTIINTPNSTYQ